MSADFLSNSAATPPEEIAREEARLALAELEPRRKDLLAALETSLEIRDDEDLRRAVDKIKLSGACREAAEAKISPVLTPYKVSAVAVSNIAAGFNGPLKDAELAVERAINGYRDRLREAAAKRRRDQDELEAKLRRQAGLESKPAAAPVKAEEIRLPSVRSDYRGQAFDRKVTTVTIDDPRALPDTILKSPAVIEALEKAVRQLARLTKDIPGATIGGGLKTTVKG